MQEELCALLTGSPAVVNLVPATRINWKTLPQGYLTPAIVLHLISGSEGMTQQGPDGLWRGRVQADCYGPTYDSALAVSRAVHGVLHGHRSGGLRGIFAAGSRDAYETASADRPTRISLDYMVNWRTIHAD